MQENLGNKVPPGLPGFIVLDVQEKTVAALQSPENQSQWQLKFDRNFALKLIRFHRKFT